MHWQNMYPHYQYYWPYTSNQQEQQFSHQNFFVFPFSPKIQYTPLVPFSQNRSEIQQNQQQNRVELAAPQILHQEQNPRVKTQNKEKQKNRTKAVALVGCQCSKSRCVKEYCFCFKNGEVCHEKCHCINCKNKKIENLMKQESKKSKVVNCNCIWSKCEKKYCQCFASGKSCGDSCNCLNCRN